MASRWMQPKLAKMAKERAEHATIIRAQRHNNLEALNAERDGKRALIALVSSCEGVMVRRVKPGVAPGLWAGKDVGLIGKRRAHRSTKTYGDGTRIVRDWRSYHAG